MQMERNYNIINMYLPCYQEVSFLVETDNSNIMIDESSLEQLMMVYCLCDLHNPNQHNFLGHDEEYRYCEGSQQHIYQDIRRKNDYPPHENHNKKLLDGYEYSTRVDLDEAGNRHTIYL